MREEDVCTAVDISICYQLTFSNVFVGNSGGCFGAVLGEVVFGSRVRGVSPEKKKHFWGVSAARSSFVSIQISQRLFQRTLHC